MIPGDSSSKPVRLGYDSRVAPMTAIGPTAQTHGVSIRTLILQALAGLPGLILTAALGILIPSLLYAAVDPWFGGHSTTDALENAAGATAWAVPALILTVILRRLRTRNRRRLSPPVTRSE